MSQLCWRGLLIKRKENVIICNTKSSYSNPFVKTFATTNDPKEFLQNASEKLKIKEMSDWYNVTKEVSAQVPLLTTLRIY